MLLAEGEEEIGSPHFTDALRDAEVLAAMRRVDGVIIPSASQGANGAVTISLGAKGIIECELVATGERWGRGPARDVHSSLKAQVDSPVWHLVEALQHARHRSWQPAGDRRLVRACPAADASANGR